MIKKFNEFINEDIRSKSISLIIDNIKQLYPDIQIQINDDSKIVINYTAELCLNEEFYEALQKDDINKDDIIFENCEKITVESIDEFTKISDYGKFGENIANFSCNSCTKLTSLEGSPKEVVGDFDCNDCYNITSLEGSPDTTYSSFGCSLCINLTSLEFAPKEVRGNFSCSYCKKLTNIDGAPHNVSCEFRCEGCNPDFIELAKEKYGSKVIYSI